MIIAPEKSGAIFKILIEYLFGICYNALAAQLQNTYLRGYYERKGNWRNSAQSAS